MLSVLYFYKVTSALPPVYMKLSSLLVLPYVIPYNFQYGISKKKKTEKYV